MGPTAMIGGLTTRRTRRAVCMGPWLGPVLASLAAAAVFVPPVVWELRNFYFGWHNVGLYTRALYNFFEFGRFAAYSDGSFDLFAEAHFTPIFFVLCLPVRLLGTAGFVGTTVVPLVGT